MSSAADSLRRLGLAEIQDVLGPVAPAVQTKISPRLTLTACRFIAHSPFVCLATASSSGADSSPRGDSPGFVRVLDDTTLALPDRTGNNLTDSFRNLLESPAIGMLFLIPGLRETLRVNGTAFVTDDADLCERMTVDLRRPRLALVVSVEQVYFHCGKALIRSQLWDPQQQSLAAAATLGTNVFFAQQIEREQATRTSAQMAQHFEHTYTTQL